jgi:hypothetical protein
VTESFQPCYGPGVNLTSNRHECQEYSGGWRQVCKADLTATCLENVGALMGIHDATGIALPLYCTYISITKTTVLSNMKFVGDREKYSCIHIYKLSEDIAWY